MLIELYGTISLNALCDLSYTMSASPSMPPGTASKGPWSTFSSNPSFFFPLPLLWLSEQFIVSWMAKSLATSGESKAEETLAKPQGCALVLGSQQRWQIAHTGTTLENEPESSPSPHFHIVQKKKKLHLFLPFTHFYNYVVLLLSLTFQQTSYAFSCSRRITI